MWNIYGSYPTYLKIAILPDVIIQVVISWIFNASAGVLAKLIIFFGFTLIGSSMYYAANSIMKEYGKREKVAVITSLIASFVYMFNFWSLNHVVHSWLWWTGYALSPLLLVCFIRALKTRRLICIVATSLLWCLISANFTSSLLAGVLILSWLLFSVIYQGKKITWSEILINLKTTGLVVVLFLAFSAYWVLPAIISGLQSGHLSPTAVPQILSADGLFTNDSVNGSLLNTFRLMGSPLVATPYHPAFQSLYSFWVIASFMVPLFAFAASVLIRKNKHILYFSLMALVFIFLNKGTHGPFGSIYYWLVHDIPFFSNQLGRLLRDVDDWGGVTALCFCFLISFTNGEILDRSWKKPNFNWRKLTGIAIVVVFISSFVLSVITPAMGYLGNIYVPVKVPAEYQRINSWLATQKEDFKVWWLPNYNWEDTTWGSRMTGSLGSAFDVLSSAKPTLWDAETGNQFDTENYYQYFYDSLLNGDSNQLGKYLIPINTRYVIFHKDIISGEGEADAAIANLEKQYDLSFVKQDGIYYIFENKNYAPQISVLSHDLLIGGGLGVTKQLNAIESFDPASNGMIYLDQNGLTALSNTAGIVLGQGNNINDIALSQVNDRYLIAPSNYTDRWKPDTYWSAANMTGDVYWYGALSANSVSNPWNFDYGKGLVVTWDYRTDLNQSEPHDISTNDASIWQILPWTSYDHMNLSSDGQSLVMDYSFDNKDSVQASAQNQTPFSLEDWSNFDTLSAQVYGDGSGNELEFWYRVNNDETKGYKIGSCNLDWTGWKEVTFTFPDALRDQVHRFVTVVNWDNNKSPEGLGSHQIKIKNIALLSNGLTTFRHVLNMPLNVEKDGQYDLYARVLESNKGGNLTFSVDGHEAGTLNTTAQQSNFVWEKVGMLSLTNGQHKLTLENTYGFNAVNLVPACKES